jgi:hypothetical protein
MHQGNSNMGKLGILTDCSGGPEQGIKVKGQDHIYIYIYIYIQSVPKFMPTDLTMQILAKF